MTDDGREDSTMWGNPWFWIMLVVCCAAWSGVGWVLAVTL